MTPRAFVLPLLALFGAFVCLSAQPNDATAAISGQVTLSGKPARKVKVTLVPGPYGSPETPGRQSIAVDDEGRYEFKNLRPGSYGLFVASYLYTSTDFADLRNPPFKVCTVAANEKLTEQDIRLVRGGVVTGRLTDADGKPLILERVRLTYVDARGQKKTYPNLVNEEMFRTDDRGVYRLFGLMPGRYLVSAGQDAGEGTQDRRVVYRRLYYPGTHDEAEAARVEVKETEEITGIDLRLGAPEKVFAVSGRVTDATTGQPVPDAVIDFMVVEKPGGKPRPWSVGMPLNQRAEFYFRGLMPAEYGVQVSAHPEKNYYGEPVSFEVKDKNLENLDVKLQRGASLSGVVVVEGVANSAEALRTTKLWVHPFHLEQHSQARPRSLAVPVQPDGSFRLGGIVPGKVWLSLGDDPKPFSLLRIERQGIPLREAIEVKTSEQITGLRLVVAAATGALRGRVNILGTLPGGAVLAVIVRNQNGQFQRSVGLDSSNGFLMQGLPDGDYEIIVTLRASPADFFTVLGEPVRQAVTIRDGAPAEAVINFPVRP